MPVKRFSCRCRNGLKRLRQLNTAEQRGTGNRIRERRLDKGIRQSDLAAAVEISPSYLNLIEHNRRRITRTLLARIAGALEVEPDFLLEGAERSVLDAMRTAAAMFPEAEVETDRIDDLAARYPGWAKLVTLQSGQIAAQAAQIQGLSDRLAYDPALATSLHEVISAVTSIRSTAAILTSEETIDADWQGRFHRNIHDDAVRLAESSGALIHYLDPPKDDPGGLKTPFEEAEGWIGDHGPHFEALERGGPAAVAELLEATGAMRGAARRLLDAHLTRYAEDAQAVPLARIEAEAEALAYDPLALAARLQQPLTRVMRRLAVLPGGKGHPPLGLALADGGGFLTYIQPRPALSLHRGGPCPLWPLFTALGQPGHPVTVDVALPGAPEGRMRCHAVAEMLPRTDYTRPATLEVTMLVQPDPPPGQSAPVPIGVACAICPRNGCPARREPSSLGVESAL